MLLLIFLNNPLYCIYTIILLPNGCFENTNLLSPPTFVLQAVDCGPLEAPLNGTRVGEKTTYLTKITFHCDDGFDMIGSISRICQANKQWSGNEPFCSGDVEICVYSLSII